MQAMTRFRGKLGYYALVGLLITAAILVRYKDPFFVRALRLVAFDYYQRLEPGHYDPNLPVRVVDIDEESLAKIGQWPWPRTEVAKLVNVLAGDGAAAIAFDVLFAEPDHTSLEEVAKQLSPADAAKLSATIGERPTNDQVLAAALKNSPSVLAVGLGSGLATSIPSKAGFAIAGDDPRPFVIGFSGASENLPEFQQAARGIGAYNWVADRDQIVRRVALVYRLGSTLVPSLAAEALRVAQGASTYIIKSSNASGETAFGQSTGINHIRIGRIEVPTDGRGEIYMKFRHFNKSVYLPAWKVLEGKVSPNEVQGRIVLIGTSASGLLDVRATPIDAAIPGVDIHAQVIEHLLTGEFLTRPDYALAVEELVIAVLGALLAITLPAVSARSAAVIGLFAVGSVVLGGWAAYRYADLLFDPSYPALVMGIMTAGITFYTYHAVETQRSHIRNAFARYLAPTVVQEVVANPDRLKLGGETRQLTLMFCDVRNFTSISERLTATELTQFINELLTPLSEIILNRRGTIDKYMGDAIMAFWNAPLDDPDHKSHACDAAVEMAKKIDELNEYWRDQAAQKGQAFHRVRIGIGLNSGECCVGNLGSTMRFDYSAIGDEVNVTSRFEGLTKMYGISTAVGERALSPQFSALELDCVQVKGRKRPEKIYTFLEPLRADADDLRRLEQCYAKFLTAYRRQSWDEAVQLLHECRKIGIKELDSCYSLFEDRIGHLRNASLPPDWDGSFEMTEK
jgi:adenylate cyclase